jgi:P27 family predicted phage terminase small subunit
MSHPVPIELRRLRGNPGKRPIPNGLRPPRLSEPPPPPDWLRGLARQEWLRLAPELHVTGVLTSLDLAAFGVVCVTLGRWLECEAEIETLRGDPARHEIMAGPLLKLATQCARDAIKFMGEFGMTPSSRCRVAADGYKGPSKFGDLIA